MVTRCCVAARCARRMLPYAHGKQLVTVVGNLPEVNPGEWLKLTGQWLNHAKHGRQFQVELCEQSVPGMSVEDQTLSRSGTVRGVGKGDGRAHQSRFGADTLTIIDENPSGWARCWALAASASTASSHLGEQRAIKDVMIFLQGHGISTIWRSRSASSMATLAVVQTTPTGGTGHPRHLVSPDYRQDRSGAGFGRRRPGADRAGIHYTLSKMADDGHVSRAAG